MHRRAIVAREERLVAIVDPGSIISSFFMRYFVSSKQTYPAPYACG